MAKYLDKSGLQYFYGKLKEKFADKTTIEAKLDSLTGAFLWKGKFDTLPPVDDYEAGNVVGVKVGENAYAEYVLTVVGNTKTWEKLGDEGSYLLKTTAEETYLKKAAGEVKTDNLANGAVTEDKIADGSITGDKFSPGLTLYMNKQFNYLKQVQVKYGEDPSAAIKSFTQRDNKTALYIKLTNGLLVPANTNGETASGLYSYGNTIRKVLFDGTNWSDAEIQNDIIDTEHIKNDAVTSNKIEDYAVIERKIADSAVASEKLVQGARKPIILTPDTTEVDEETYQKLLSDDVDVVFKLDSGNLFLLTDKIKRGGLLNLYFTCLSVEGLKVTNVYLYGYKVSITKSGPHNCSVTRYIGNNLYGLFELSNYLTKSTLTPILKEIDLIGTDAERKAKLDKFETDWKALTGASDLRGARFVGYVDNTDNSGTCSVLFTFDYGSNVLYQGCVMESDTDKKIVKYTLNKNDGSLVLTPLFSHLEAITIYTDNTEEHVQANLDNIAAYESNLQALGVDTTKSPMIPIIIDEGQGEEGNSRGYLQKISAQNTYYGIIVTGGTETYSLEIDVDGTFTGYHILDSSYKSLNAKSLEAITIKTSNSTTDKADNKAAIQAYVNNLKALGVDTTKGYYIPVVFVESADYYRSGIMVYNSTSDTYNGYTSGTSGLPISAQIRNDGGVYLNNIQLSSSTGLSTTSKQIVGAINEVNTLAKGKQDTLTSGTNIKTVNGQSLLGSGDISISGGGSGDVTAAGNNTFTGINTFSGTETFDGAPQFNSGLTVVDATNNDRYKIYGDNYGLVVQNIDDNNSDIRFRGILTPEANNDAANKSYVDTQISTALGTVLTQLQNI